MSWSIGGPDARGRFVGYGVPAYCDAPGCGVTIDRGLSYVCGGNPFGGEHGCGLYFCAAHQHIPNDSRDVPLCSRCLRYRSPYKRISGEHPEWMQHVLTDDSWAEWRAEEPAKVAAFQAALSASEPVPPPGREG